MTAAGPVLVLSDQPLIAALVGLLLELAGHRPVFANSNEQPADALDRQRPIAVIMIDAEMDAARSDLFFALTARRSVGVVVYGAETRLRSIGEIAAERKIPWCTLPSSAERLGAAIERSLAGPDKALVVRSDAERRVAEATSTADGTSLLHDAGGYRWVVYDRRTVRDRRSEAGPPTQERVFVREDGTMRRCDLDSPEPAPDRSPSVLEEQLARATE